MKVYLLTQDERTGWDTFDSMVVVAADEEAARQLHPSARTPEESEEYWKEDWLDCWASTPERVEVRLLGEAEANAQAGIVLASFNAG